MLVTSLPKAILQKAGLIQRPYLPEQTLQILGFADALQAKTFLGKISGLFLAIIHIPGTILQNRKIRKENASIALQNRSIQQLNQKVMKRQEVIKKVLIESGKASGIVLSIFGLMGLTMGICGYMMGRMLTPLESIIEARPNSVTR